MNIFEQLNDIVCLKKNKLATNLEDETEFVPFLTQRWLSMYSAAFAEVLNMTSNRLWRVMDDKQMWYKLFTSILPKSPNKRIRYFKKTKKNKKVVNTEIITYIANLYEISHREVKMYLDQNILDLKQIKKELNLS